MNDKKRIKEIEREEKQLNQLAQIIRFVLEIRTDIQFIPDLAFPIAKELLKHYQPKLPENAVVLTKEEYEILLSNADNAFQEGLNENRDLFEQEVKDEVRKETAREILKKVNEFFRPFDKKSPIFLDLLLTKLESIVKQLGVEIKE